MDYNLKKIGQFCVTIQMKASAEYFPVVFFILLCNTVLTDESVDKILKCDHSNQGYQAILSIGIVWRNRLIVFFLCSMNNFMLEKKFYVKYLSSFGENTAKSL